MNKKIETYATADAALARFSDLAKERTRQIAQSLLLESHEILGDEDDGEKVAIMVHKAVKAVEGVFEVAH